eukprot:696028-Prorocentrum_minimum.AAC.2
MPPCFQRRFLLNVFSRFFCFLAFLFAKSYAFSRRRFATPSKSKLSKPTAVHSQWGFDSRKRGGMPSVHLFESASSPGDPGEASHPLNVLRGAKGTIGTKPLVVNGHTRCSAAADAFRAASAASAAAAFSRTRRSTW